MKQEKESAALKFLRSPEGKKSAIDFFKEIKDKQTRLEARLTRFHDKHKDNTDVIMAKLLAKYNSKAYRDKEYRLGYEPREPLLWFMFEYAKKYGQECEDKQYINTFTSEIYYIGSYVIQVMQGQGAVIRVDKVNSFKSFPEFEIIKKFYGKKKAKRSGVPLINHIQEGLIILDKIGASSLAKKAYCLHPFYQDDKALESNVDTYTFPTPIMIRIMEYRSVANEYLSHRSINSIDEIRLSPLKDVNDMLIADKVQNRKDFEIHHLGKHQRSEELGQYFKNWLERLEISEERYQQFKKDLVMSI